MKTYLVDDEIYSTDVLLEKYCPQVEIVGIFNHAEKALKAIQAEPPQLLFLDIDMPRLDGFELLNQCTPFDFKVIFTTAYNQYALKAFRFNALDYLLKPVDKNELINAVAKAQNPKIEQMTAVQMLTKNPERIALPIGNELVFVEVSDIIHAVSEGSYISIFLKNQVKPIVLTKSLRELEEVLNNPHFFRVHNSHLINLKQIKKITKTDGGDLTMMNNAIIPVARSKKVALMEMIVKI
jgi:two-component system, LytTR family, response regulator